MSKLPNHIIKQWPEVFGDVEIQAIPLNYVNNINVVFTNGKIWQIGVTEQDKEDLTYLEDMLDSLFEEYEDDIKTIDFSLDAQKVKQDITNRTKTFMKKRK